LRFLQAFRQGLRELGYVEGQNIAIELRSADQKYDRLPGLAAELVRLKVSVIVAATPPAVQAAQRATETIPIVMAAVADPVALGFVDSLGHPGRNITGLSSIQSELIGKRLEVLKEVVPKVCLVAVLANPANPNCARGDPMFRDHRTRIAEHAIRRRLPAVFVGTEFAEAGGLLAYGRSLSEGYRRAANYVDKILKGAKAADISIEQPVTFELVINLKTAKASG
jgi:putative tryptophan/tyrosine transport system substrate-binding protein